MRVHAEYREDRKGLFLCFLAVSDVGIALGSMIYVLKFGKNSKSETARKCLDWTSQQFPKIEKGIIAMELVAKACNRATLRPAPYDLQSALKVPKTANWPWKPYFRDVLL